MEGREHARTGIVLSGGGAHGAYEAGVLSYLFEEIYPQLRPHFEFDVVAGTSVGAIHAGYLASTAHLPGAERAQGLHDIWGFMALDQVLSVSPRDLVEVPLRALGMEQLIRSRGAQQLMGGLVDITPLERLVDRHVPWSALRDNLASGCPGALAVACTEIATGSLILFLEGPLADPELWRHDPHAVAVRTTIDSRHVRASAAIPFLFPAVAIDGRWYMDGGLRVNTPLSPALRLGAEKLVVVALRHSAAINSPTVGAERAISQPAFLLGKVLNVLMLDQLENELYRLEMVNALLEGASSVYGSQCLDRINSATRAKRGLEYRRVEHVVIRPSRDVGALAAEAYEHRERASRGVLAFLLARAALLGVPERQADLLSYVYFDASFTAELFELGREDAKARRDELLELLSESPTNAAARGTEAA